MCKKKLICIVCPRGCRLEVAQDKEGMWQVSNYGCKRGIEYGIDEVTVPKRMLSTTVKVKGGTYPRIPVIGDCETPKEKIPDCLDQLYRIQLEAPIKAGTVLVENIAGTGTNIIAAMSMRERK